jgi:hypothetical protein
MGVDPPPYPVTPHLRGSHGVLDDEIMTAEAVERILAAGPLLIQEKLDGINIGVRVGSDISVTFKKPWLGVPGGIDAVTAFAAQRLRGVAALTPSHVMYFEWIDPRRLKPGIAVPWFLIDVLDLTSGRLVETRWVHEIAISAGLGYAPVLGSQRLRNVQQLSEFLGPSGVVVGLREGVILRREREGVVLERYKFVRPGHEQRNGGPA